VKRYEHYGRKLWIDMENTEENCDMIWKIQFNLPFFHIFHIFSLFNLFFYHTFQILSQFILLFFHIFTILLLFHLPFFYIFHIISLYSSIFSLSFHYFLPYFPNHFTIQFYEKKWRGRGR
jgi:hypothetical protein